MSEQSRKFIDDAVRAQIAETGAGDATAIVCMDAGAPGFFADDKFDDCIECGCKVRYRPYMPDLPKVCVACWGLNLAGAP